MSPPNRFSTFNQPTRRKHKLTLSDTATRVSFPQADKDLIANLVLQQGGELSATQIRALALATKHTRAAIKRLIETARDDFVASAGRYVEIHKQATEGALAEGDHEQALKGSQWAMEKISGEGVRIVEKENTNATGSRIMIGIRVGGIDDPVVKVESNG